MADQLSPTPQNSNPASPASPSPTSSGSPAASLAPSGSPAASPAGNPQARPCPKDCSQCTWGHQIYCTAKMTFDSFTVMNAIIQRLDSQSAKIDAQSLKIAELSGRIAAIESGQSEFATPSPIQSDLFPSTE